MLLRSGVDHSRTPNVFASLKTPVSPNHYSLASPPPASSSGTEWAIPATPQTPCPVRGAIKPEPETPRTSQSPSLPSLCPAKAEPDVEVKPEPLDLEVEMNSSELAARTDKLHALAMIGRVGPLAEVDPSDVVSITLKCRRKDLETCGYFNWDVISTLHDMEEVGVRQSLVTFEDGGPPVVAVNYTTYPLPKSARLQ